MLVRAWVQEQKRSDYGAAAWQPEPELSQSSPRSVSFSSSTKLVGAFTVVVLAIMFCFACLPNLKQAFLTAYGVPTKGTIEQRYIHETRGRSRRNFSYYLVVRYETPSGWQSARIQTSMNYYAGSPQGKSVPIHYLARVPSQVVLDDDERYQPWGVLVALITAVAVLGLPYYMYRRMRTIAGSGTVVKGLITKINRRLNNCYLTVYYEFQEVPYQGTIAVRANQANPNWQPGRAVTLLVAPDPPSSRHGPHVVMLYPAPEFKINP